MLKIYVRHGLIFDLVHEIISFEQSKWLKIFIKSNTQKK